MKRKLILFFVIMFLSINVFAIEGDVDGDNLVKTNDYLLIKKHILGSAILTGNKLKNADVNKDGKISALDYIRVKKIIINGFSTKINVTSISLNKSSVNLETNDTYKINYTISPSDATNKAVTWKSSNTKIATVSSDGIITTKSLFGKATITATTSDGEYKANITVNVTKDRIHFINIGEAGNAILIDSYSEGKNHYVLIDAANCLNNVSCGSKQIDNYIGSKIQYVKSDGTLEKNGGVKKIDAVIISHMHYDHAGYMSSIIEKYKPDKVIVKNYSTSKEYFKNIKAAANKVGSTIVYPTEGSQYTFGNYKFRVYNTTDVIGTNNYNENINSLVVMASITKGDKTYLTYLPGDLELGKNKSNNKIVLDPTSISKKIQNDFGISKSRPVDIYVAAHHGYYNNDASTGLGINTGVNNHASTISPLYIKSSIITNTFGWMCSKTNNDQYQGIKNIYDNLVKNNGDLKIRFSGANRVKAIFRAKGIELSGGEILSCNTSSCGSTSSIHNTIKTSAPQCARKNYIK